MTLSSVAISRQMGRSKAAVLNWGAYINFQGGASPNVFYNTSFINFEINVFSLIACLRHYCE